MRRPVVVDALVPGGCERTDITKQRSSSTPALAIEFPTGIHERCGAHLNDDQF
jgi:hypothetical protein